MVTRAQLSAIIVTARAKPRQASSCSNLQPHALDQAGRELVEERGDGDVKAAAEFEESQHAGVALRFVDVSPRAAPTVAED